MFEKIEEERISQKLTICSLCRRADITVPSYHRLRIGKSNFETIKKLCRALKIKEFLFKVE